MSYGNQPPPPPPPGGQYGAPGGYAQPKTNQKALWALITGILSLICCGIVAGIPAMILGNSAKKEIAASGGTQSGGGMAQAGFILGIISIAITLLWIILYATGAATFNFSSNS
jgi:hypothetical protein